MTHIEIERKFLVKNTLFKKDAHQKSYIKQGFLNSDKARTVRIRILENKGFLTIKGASNKSGLSRFEWEKEISVNDAEKLFLLIEEGSIEKYRYYITIDKHTFEVDEFLGANLGLIVAEIELSSEEEPFKKPDWLGKEVTGDKKYYNTVLSKHPYNTWT